MKIFSLTFKNGEPFVRFSDQISESAWKDSVYPGKNSEPCLPTPSFAMAIEHVADLLIAEYDLSVEYDWKPATFQFKYDEDGEWTFTAQLKGFNPDIGKQSVTIDPNGCEVPEHVAAKIEKLLSECAEFVNGASAQGSLF